MAGAVTVSFKVNQAAIDRLLTAPNGPVMKWMRDLGKRVAVACAAEAPRGDTGKLAADVRSEVVGSGRQIKIRVGNTAAMNVRGKSPKSRATFIVKGTANEGRGYIFPTRAKFLRFEVGGEVVYARKVRGIAPNDYLTRGLERTFASL